MRISDIIRRVRQPEPAPCRSCLAPASSTTESAAVWWFERARRLSAKVLSDWEVLNESLLADLYVLADEAVELAQTPDHRVMDCFFSPYAPDRTYFPHSAANVCILSVVLGRAQSLGGDGLRHLAVGALLHDLGLVRQSAVILQQRLLTEDEIRRVRTHPLLAKESLYRIAPQADFLLFDILMHYQERNDASGYPHGLAGGKICEPARILAVADVYEALTHDRPHRGKFEGREPIRTLVADKHRFEYGVMKSLLDMVGMYPVGTMVRLNTRETARVIDQNYQQPLRPVLEVAATDPAASPEKKIIDLANHYSLYITESIQ